MRTSLTRAIAGTAIAAAAVLTAAGTASAAMSTTPVKAPTTLSIVEAKAKITIGQKDVISGTLLTGTKPVLRQVVRLYRYNTAGKKWILAQARVTGKLGRVFYTVKPRATTSYELVFLGGAHLLPSHSAVATITVTK